MTGKTPTNEWGVESSGFVTTEFPDYREKKNGAKGVEEQWRNGCQLQRNK